MLGAGGLSWTHVVAQNSSTPEAANAKLEASLSPAPAGKSTRVISHAPEVPQPPAEVSAEYRAAITASAQRYRELYAAAQLTQAIAEARTGLQLAVEANRPRDEAEFLKAALYASWLMGESASGFDYGQRLLTYADKFNDDRLRSIAHRVIGTIYGQLKNQEKLREHNRLALTAAERAGDASLRMAALNNYGNILILDGDLAGARRVHTEVLAYREAHGHRWDAAGTLTNLGDIEEKAGNLPEALALQRRALTLRTELDDRRGQVRSLTQVAALLRQLQRPDEALSAINEALRRAQEIKGRELLALVYGELARLRETRAEFAEALAAERLAAHEREQMAGEQARVRAAEFAARLELARKEEAIEQLDRARLMQAADLKLKEAEISRQQAELHAQASEASTARWQRFGLIGLILVGVVGAYAAVSRQRLRLAAERRIHAEALAAKEAAEQANALKSRLIGIVSHDIRSPLSSIVGLTDELRDELPAGATDERLDLIAHQADLLLGLAQDLLDAAALESGGIRLDRTTVDLGEIAHASLGHFSVRARAKKQRLVFFAAPGADLLCSGDAVKLHQVITNLVSNALKYSPAGATIELRATREADTVRLSVVDEGPGIAPEEITRLFQPFTQLRARPTGGESSHGLGLSIAHELVRLHGGRIRVEPAPGRGSVFIIELPVAPA